MGTYECVQYRGRKSLFCERENEASMCNIFAEHLTWSTLDWLYKLAERLIDSFTQLSTAFVKQYSMFMEKFTSNADLWALFQGPKDSFRYYLKIFKETLAKMSYVNDLTVLGDLKCELWHESWF